MFGRRRDLVDQVARHALLERVAAAEDRHAARVARRRTAPPGRPSCPRRRCGRRGRARSAPRCARRRRRCPCRRAGRSPSIGSCRHETPQARMIVRARRTSPPSRCTWRVAGSMPRDRPGDEDLGAEPARLLQRAARELVAGDARREAEVVLDPRRGAGLAARRLALDHDRAQPLRRAVHGGREPGRPGADDHGVVLGRGRLGARGRAARPPGAAAAAPPSCRRRRGSRGQSSSAGSGPPHCSAASGVSGVDPPEGDLVAVEEVAQLRAGGVPAVRRPRSRAAAAGRPRCPAGRRCRSRASSPSLTPRRRASRPRPRGSPAASMRRTRDGSAARNPTGNTVAERDRHLAEDVARRRSADDALDAVDER